MCRFLVLLIVGASLCCACGKIELPELGGGGVSSGGGSLPDDVEGFDTLTVARIADCPDDTIVVVKGYVVGYISGNSLSTGAAFGLPDVVNTNMLLADSPEETDYLKCLPVRLEKSENYGYRDALNLYDHPQNYRRCILLLAGVGSYFRAKGITRVYDYEWLQEIPDSVPPVVPEPAPEYPEPDIVTGRDTLLNGR